MVGPGARRQAVAYLRTSYAISERRVCRAMGLWRSVCRYRSRRGVDGPLRERLRGYAAVRRRWGYRRLHWLARRDGFTIGRTRFQRIYQEEGLQVRKRRRSRCVAAARVPRPAVCTPDAS